MTGPEQARHDLRNHLAVIRGFTELMLVTAPADHPHRADLEAIAAAAASALALLDQVFADGDRSKRPRRPSKRPTDL